MRSSRLTHQALCARLLTLLSLGGCNSVVGLDDLSVSDEVGSKAECTTNQQCTDRATADAPAGSTAPVAAVCVKPAGKCVQLLSEDCDSITGEWLDDQAIVLGSLFSTKGAQAATNLPRQQSAALAIEKINAVGGVPSGSTSAHGRPLVMVSCDESTNLLRAAGHLVGDLRVPAIVGPNTSQDTLDVSTNVTVPAGTVVMTPTGVASSIASLSDDDLTWLMVPSDVQRAPLMIAQIGELERSLKAERSTPTIKLSIIFRNDALGSGTRTSLNDLVINAKRLADPVNLGANVQIDAYKAADSDQQAIISKHLDFAPDIVVLAGTAEAITKVLVPLESQWKGEARPHYVLIDSTKVPELLTAVTDDDDLRHRVRGTGITPGPSGADTPAEAFNGFQVDYGVRYNGATATISGMGPSHDAAYAIGLALAATTDEEVSGKSIARGLRRLSGGSTRLQTSGTDVLPAFQKLSSGEKITTVGTFGVLEWDTNGAVVGGTLEMWCIGTAANKAVYQASGLTFDIKTQEQRGAYVHCTP